MVEVYGTLLFGSKRGGGIRAEQIHDEIVRVVGAAILEGGDVNGIGICVAQTLGNLDRRMNRVVMAHIAAEKTDHDRPRIAVGAHGVRFDGGSAHRDVG